MRSTTDNSTKAGTAESDPVSDIRHQSGIRWERSEGLYSCIASIHRRIYRCRQSIYFWTDVWKQDYYSNTFEWCREGIVPQIDNLIRISADSMPVWHEKFLRGETIIIHDLEKTCETMPLEYDILKVQDIHSLLVLPLFANTQLSGFIGLDNPDLVNPGVSISLLSNAGGHLASTLNNLRMFRMLEENRKHWRAIWRNFRRRSISWKLSA